MMPKCYIDLFEISDILVSSKIGTQCISPLQAHAGEEDSAKAEALALTIVKAASARGMNPNANTPWILEAAKHRPQLLPLHKRFWPRGGKPDDCTAVVAYMQPDDKQY